MCRNITTLRGLEPPATGEEIEAAARQYVRKVSGLTRPTPATEAAFEQAVAAVARATAEVLSELTGTPDWTDELRRRVRSDLGHVSRATPVQTALRNFEKSASS